MIRARLLCAGLLGGIACAPVAAPPPPPAEPAPVSLPSSPDVAPPPIRPTSLMVKYGPAAAPTRYHVHRQIDRTQEFGGAIQRSTLGFSIFLTTAIAGGLADSLGYPATVTIDSLVADSGVALPPSINLSLARGLRYNGFLTTQGEFRDRLVSDALAARALAPIIGGFREFFPRIPPGGVTLGTAWTDTTSHQDQLGLIDSVTVKTIEGAQAVAWENRAGVPALRIQIRSVVTLAGRGQQAGQAVELTGSGTRIGEEYLGADGRYLGGVSRDSTALTITLHAQGQVVPVRQIALSIVQVLP